MKQVWGGVLLTAFLMLGLSPLWATPTEISQGLPRLNESELRPGLPVNRPSWDLEGIVNPADLVMPACHAQEGNEFVISGRGGVPSDPRSLLRGEILWVDRPLGSRMDGRSEDGGTLETLPISEQVQWWQRQGQRLGRDGDRPGQSLALTALSLLYQDLGQWSDAMTASDGSLAVLPDSPESRDVAQAQAIALNGRGRAYFLQGQPHQARETWQAAQTAYDQAQLAEGRWGSLLNQIQALQTLGYYPQAREALISVLGELEALEELSSSGLMVSRLMVQAQAQLGEVLQLLAEPQQSQEVLQQGLSMAQQLGDADLTAQLQFRLANGHRDQQRLDVARSAYEAVLGANPGPDVAFLTRLNLLAVLVDRKDLAAAQAQLDELEVLLRSRPPSRQTSYGRINLSQSLRRAEAIAQRAGTAIAYQGLAAQQLSQAVEASRRLRDRRGQSYGLGQLAQLYEQAEQWDAAQQLTQQALTLAQTLEERLDSRDLKVLWQWQLGRILDKLGQQTEAIALYRDTVSLLDELRLDLVSFDPELQFSYRQQIEPVYLGLVRLLLERAETGDSSHSDPNFQHNSQPNSQQTAIREAQSTLISLRLTELNNFFRETCLEADAIDVEDLDESAAVLYTAVLSDRLAVILSLAGEDPILYETHKPRTEIEEGLAQMLESINPAVAEEDRLERSAQVYDWLIRPLQEVLRQHQIKTLVFVPDGPLRNLPLGALYDRTSGEYLIEEYAIALSQRLQLLEAGSLANGEFKALLGGLSEAHQGFSAIPAVELEVAQIAQLLPESESLLNQAFTRDALVAQSRNDAFNVIHLATHGQFSSRADETFLLTWEGRINVEDLDVVLRSPTRPNPIDLLVLSACQTARGDDRATLGIAGFALRSGARSTLATLWSVQDEPTAELMIEFYQQLWANSGQKKAESLRQAQLALLRSSDYQHPAYWSPFVLLGNWL